MSIRATDTPSELDALIRATDELINSALNLAAYAQGLAKSGYGQRDTARNMAAEVERKAHAARAALRASDLQKRDGLPHSETIE